MQFKVPIFVSRLINLKNNVEVNRNMLIPVAYTLKRRNFYSFDMSGVISLFKGCISLPGGHRHHYKRFKIWGLEEKLSPTCREFEGSISDIRCGSFFHSPTPFNGKF